MRQLLDTLTPEGIEKLKAQGYLGEDTYGQLNAALAPTPSPTPTAISTPAPPSPTPLPAPTPVVKPSMLFDQPLTDAETSRELAEAETPTEVAAVKNKVEDRVKKIEAAETALQDIAVQAAASGIARANEESAYAQQNIDNIEKFTAEKAQDDARIKATIDEEIRKESELRDKYAAFKVDPAKTFGEGVTFSKILAGIGFALGAAGQLQGDKVNKAYEIIKDQINRSVEQQKFELDKIGAEYSQQRAYVSDLRAAYGDERTQKIFDYRLKNDLVQAQIKKIASQSKSETVALNAQELVNKLEIDKQERLLKYEKDLKDNEAIGLTQLELATLPPSADPKIERARALAIYNLPKEIDAVPGLGVGRKGKNVDALKTKTAAFKSLKRDIGVLQELIKQGIYNPVGEAAARARSLGSNLHRKYVSGGGLGAYDKGTQALAEKAFPESFLPRIVFSDSYLAALDETLNSAENHLLEEAQANLTTFSPQVKLKLQERGVDGSKGR